MVASCQKVKDEKKIAFGEITLLFGKYINPIKSALVLDKLCKDVGIESKKLTFEDLPLIILQVSRSRKYFEDIDDRHFNKLLQEITRLSNEHNEHITRDDIKEIKSRLIKSENT